MVEHTLGKGEVGGSIPLLSSIEALVPHLPKNLLEQHLFFGRILPLYFAQYKRPVVQLVEHRSPKPKVGGSSPSWPAIVLWKRSGSYMGSVEQYKAINWLNLTKWLFVFVILVAGIAGNSLFDKDYSVIVRAAVMLLLVVVAAAIAISTEQGATFWRLVKESRAEVRRVVWPTRQETWQTTLVVGLVVLVTALFLWCLDWLLNLSISWLVG